MSNDVIDMDLILARLEIPNYHKDFCYIHHYLPHRADIISGFFENYDGVYDYDDYDYEHDTNRYPSYLDVLYLATVYLGEDYEDYEDSSDIYIATFIFDYNYHKIEEKRKELNKTIYDFLPSNLCCLTELIVSFIP